MLLITQQAYALVNVHQHDGSISLWHGGVEMVSDQSGLTQTLRGLILD